jgi:hypothetical protein
MNEVWFASKVLMKIIHILVGKHEENIADDRRRIW